MEPTQLANLPATVALLVVMGLAVRYMTAQAEKAQAKVLELLTDTLKNNTHALDSVAHVLTRCPGARPTDTQFFTPPPSP